MTIHRMFDLPSPSELFERARSWFADSPDSTTADTGRADNGTAGNGTANHGGGNPSADPAGQLPADPNSPLLPARSTELVGRRNSMSALLRQGSSMAEVDANQSDQSVADALSPREWDELVDLVVERLEDRVRDELARRGRRFSPGVF